MWLKNACRHIALVERHRHLVFRHCVRCGIGWRGLFHDLSKFSPAEFFESVRYFQGNRSPIGACRRATGMSKCWLHHKGRNRHHPEYWCDDDCEVMPLMPYTDAVECICDKLAATKTYRGKDFAPRDALAHWGKYGSRVRANEKTKAFIRRVLSDYAEYGEDAVLDPSYMKKTYHEICE